MGYYGRIRVGEETMQAKTIPPDVDFPAAHSMDSEWFAVDQDGNIAVFDTGESGVIPEVAQGADQGAVFEILDQLAMAFDLPSEADYKHALSELRLERLGVFLYRYDDYQGEPYEREFAPKAPKKLDQLPAPLQKIFGSVRFYDIKFESFDRVWPRRYFECTGWGNDDM